MEIPTFMIVFPNSGARSVPGTNYSYTGHGALPHADLHSLVHTCAQITHRPTREKTPTGKSKLMTVKAANQHTLLAKRNCDGLSSGWQRTLGPELALALAVTLCDHR